MSIKNIMNINFICLKSIKKSTNCIGQKYQVFIKCKNKYESTFQGKNAKLANSRSCVGNIYNIYFKQEILLLNSSNSSRKILQLNR